MLGTYLEATLCRLPTEHLSYYRIAERGAMAGVDTGKPRGFVIETMVGEDTRGQRVDEASFVGNNYSKQMHRVNIILYHNFPRFLRALESLSTRLYSS